MYVVVSIIALLLASSAWSAQRASVVGLEAPAAGDLDPTFGVGGKVIVDFARYYSTGNALAIRYFESILNNGRRKRKYPRTYRSWLMSTGSRTADPGMSFYVTMNDDEFCVMEVPGVWS